MTTSNSELTPKEILALVCGCEEYEVGLLTEVLTFQEKFSLSKIDSREMQGLQELLFRIMTTSYDLMSKKIIDGVSLQKAIVEAASVINRQVQRYSGNYGSLVNEYGLTPLHLKVLSRKMSVDIIHCADDKNMQMVLYRRDQEKYLNNWDVASTFREFIRQDFSFEDTIYLMHQLTLKQLKEFKNNSFEFDSCVHWVKQTLMQYYKMTLEDAMHTVTSMIMSDKDLPPHIANIARPFRNQYHKIYSADNNQHYGLETLPQADILNSESVCHFLMERTPPTNFSPYGARISTEICENLVFPTGILIMGAVGALYLLFANKNCLRRVSVSAFSLFTNCKRKHNPQHPSPSMEMDVDSATALHKTA